MIGKKKYIVFTICIFVLTIFVICINVNNHHSKSYKLPWYFEKLGLTNIKSNNSDKKIKVAFLDTGLNYEIIPSLDNDIEGGYNCLEKNDDFNDYNGHGTSIICLACLDSKQYDYAGICKNITIVPVVVANEFGVTSEELMNDGIIYAMSQSVDIINISIGSRRYSEKIDNTLKIASERGIIINCSTGDFCSSDITYPAKSDYTYAISAQSMLGCKYINSNYNSDCILVPGEKIDVIKYDSYSRKFVVVQQNGSSFSCAIFTGIVSIVLSNISSEKNREEYFLKLNEYKNIDGMFLNVLSL